MLVLCLFILLCRLALPLVLARYSLLGRNDRFEIVRRMTNLFSQTVLSACYTRILFHAPSHAHDVLYGYSSFAHTSFLLAIGAYLVDAILYAAHPSPPSLTSVWITHHGVALLLLVWNVSFRHTSAFPAAIFLVSNLAHPFVDLRWLLIVFDFRGPRISTAANALCCVAVTVAHMLPPPYLVGLAASARDLSIMTFVLHEMRVYCWVFSLLIYIPHLLCPVYQAQRLVNGWMKPAQRFRADVKEA